LREKAAQAAFSTFTKRPMIEDDRLMSKAEIQVDQITRGPVLTEAKLAHHGQGFQSRSDASSEAKKVAVTTLGCKVNTYES